MAVTTITVTGTFLLTTGGPASGQVDFVLSAVLQDAAAKRDYPMVVQSAPLTAGAFSISLPATNDPTSAPTGLTYQITERIVGAPARTYNVPIAYTAAAGTVDLSALAPVANTAVSASYVLLTAVGAPNGVAPLGADSKVPAANLPASTGGGIAATTLSAKGSLIGATAAGVPADVPVGAAGTVLTSIPGNASGLGFTTPAAGAGTAGVFDVRAYGATGNGTTDDNAAIQSAFTAAKAAGAGGTILFPPGVYLCSGVLNLDGLSAITIKGFGSRVSQFATTTFPPTRSELRYTGTGTGIFLSAAGSDGLTIDGIAISYSLATFTGTLLSITKSATIWSYGFSMKNCVVGGSQATAINATLVDINGCVEHDFNDVLFERGLVGVSGRTSGAYANAVTFWSCHFAGVATAVLDPYAQWVFVGCVFECQVMAQTGPVAPIKSSFSPIQSLSFIGCGFWDATSGGAWIDVFGAGLSVTNCYWEPQGGASEGLVRVRTTAAYPSFDGLTITGLRAEGMNGSTGSPMVTYLPFAGTHPLTNVNVFNGNSLKNVVDGLSAIVAPMVFSPHTSSSTVVTTTVTTAYAATRVSAQKILLTAASCALTFPAVTTDTRTSIDLLATQDAIGGRLLTYPQNLVWPGGIAPTLATAAGRQDLLRAETFDGGSLWLGSVRAANLPGVGVTTVPGAPTGVTTTPGNALINVSWAAPASTGGTAITDYLVQYRTTTGPGAWTTFAHAASTSTTIAITGLTNATSYDVQVAAINSVGAGAFSSPVSTATPSSAASLIVNDTFTRADTAGGTLGTANTGQVWTVTGGGLSIGTNQVKSTLTTDQLALIPSGISDCTVLLTAVNVVAGVNDIAIYFRTTDLVNNWFRVVHESGTLYLQKTVAGTKSTVTSAVYQLVNGDIMSVVLAGSSIICKVNGVTKITATDAQFQTVTTHGFGLLGLTTQIVDNFQVTSP